MQEEIQRLRKIEKQIIKAETEIQRDEGKLSLLNDSLKNEYNCSDLKEARELLSSLAAQREKLTSLFNKTLSDLENNHEWE